MMRNTLASVAIVALGLAIPQMGHAQNYDRPSFNIPVPNVTIGNGREQQAQANDHARYCEDLRHRADDLRYRRDNAQYRDDAGRAQDRLREVNDQLRRDCNRY